MKKLFKYLGFILNSLIILLFCHPNRYKWEFEKLRKDFDKKMSQE